MLMQIPEIRDFFAARGGLGPTFPTGQRGDAGLAPGTVVEGRYEVVRLLASGGMGSVYLARQVALRRPCALKVLRTDFAREPEFVARFRREALLSARIDHEAVVRVLDFATTADGLPCCAMEYLEGVTLKDLLAGSSRRSLREALGLAAQLASALEAIHACGVVHRDVKPDNLMVVGRGREARLKVIDFGVAFDRAGTEVGLTIPGMVLGTPQYMSPEQALGLQTDARADVYSMGLILFELLTGQPAFTGQTPSIVMVKQITEPAPSLPSDPHRFPPGLELLVAMMLEKQPGARPQSAREVRLALEAFAGARG